MDAIGRTYFGIGKLASFLDSVIIDKSDIIEISLDQDSVIIASKLNNLGVHLNWLNEYYKQFEKDYKKILAPISSIPDNIDELKGQKIPFHNDFESWYFSTANIYMLDRYAYQKNKEDFDDQIYETYVKWDSLIANTELDLGAQKILENTLFVVMIDKVGRLGATMPEWMFDRMNQMMKDDCTAGLTTEMLNYYINYLTEKHFQKIAYSDLEKAYDQFGDVPCSNIQKELQRMCLIRMMDKSYNTENTQQLLENHVAQFQDSSLLNRINEQYGFHELAASPEDIVSPFTDIHEAIVPYADLVSERNGKVVLVDFWASWCGPCRKSMPDVKELTKKFGSEGFEVIYASIDQHPNQWKRASKDEGIYEDNNFSAIDFYNSELYKKYSITHIPRYFIYNQVGQLIYEKPMKTRVSDLEDIIVDLLNKTL